MAPNFQPACRQAGLRLPNSNKFDLLVLKLKSPPEIGRAGKIVVEPAGFEPASKQGTNRLSTCLSYY